MNKDLEPINKDNNYESNDYVKEENKEVNKETFANDWLDWLETNVDWNLISISSIWVFLTLTFFGIMF